MSTNPLFAPSYGSYTADQIHEDEYCELSQGRRIHCTPASGDHAGINTIGASVIDSDPAVRWSGVDAGFSPDNKTLCAPDVAVAAPEVADKEGWIQGVPPLAVEYAAKGQNEKDFQTKIRELLDYGTQVIWGVRLVGPRRVEVYTPHASMRIAKAGEQLLAPGILQNPVPVEALYDREAGRAATLRNLLQRQGYADLDAVLEAGYAKGVEKGTETGREEGIKEGRKKGLEEGMKKGRKEGIKEGLEKGREEGLEKGREEGVSSALTLLLTTRFGTLPAWVEQRIAGASLDQLERWMPKVLTAPDLKTLFAD